MHNKFFEPKSGDTIRIIHSKRFVSGKRPEENEIIQEKRGKLDYLGGPIKKKKSEQPVKSAASPEEKKFSSIGRYVGDGKRLTAFVMLDPEDFPDKR